MEAKPLNVAVIIGSVRAGRFGPTVANWFADHARKREDMAITLIDLADYDFPVDMSQNDSTAKFTKQIGESDAVVIVTPEYNHSYSGPLKTAIDTMNTEWNAKPIAFVAYGGLSGGLRAVEALRVVFAEVHAMSIRDTLSFHSARSQFNEAGQPINTEAVNTAADTLLRQLSWWGNALRAARADQPYVR